MTDYERKALTDDELLERVLEDIGGLLPRITIHCVECPVLPPWDDKEPENG